MSGSHEKINTTIVKTYAKKINTARLNTKIAEEKLVNKMNSLNSHWNSPAAQRAIESFREIQNRFESYDYILQNYASFLSIQIGEGYDYIEENNKLLGENLESKFY